MIYPSHDIVLIGRLPEGGRIEPSHLARLVEQDELYWELVRLGPEAMLRTAFLVADPAEATRDLLAVIALHVLSVKSNRQGLRAPLARPRPDDGPELERLAAATREQPRLCISLLESPSSLVSVDQLTEGSLLDVERWVRGSQRRWDPTARAWQEA